MRFAPSSVVLFVIGLTLRTTATSADSHSHGNRGKDAHRQLERSGRGGVAEESSTIATVTDIAGSRSSGTPTAVVHSSWAFQRRANTTTTSSSSSGSTSTSSVTLPLPPSTPPTSPPSPAPTPLDLSISYALSTSCVNYLTTLLSSSTFISCLPFSLLLTTSTGYSSIVSSALSSGDYSTLNSLIAYTSSPQPNGTACDTYMSSVQKNLGAKGNCGTDINSDSPVQVALQAKNGVGNYQLMRSAEQLIDPDSGVYCYLKAVQNDKPDDLYLYQIPAGIALPSTSTPSCSKCSALLLNTYSSNTSSSQTLNSTLVNSAITRVNNACGPTFVSLAAESTSTTSSSGASIILSRFGSPLSSLSGLGVVAISMMMMMMIMMM